MTFAQLLQRGRIRGLTPCIGTHTLARTLGSEWGPAGSLSSTERGQVEEEMARLWRDDVSLFYEEAGQGEPPLVLIHCWGGDHRLMARQHEHFQRHHRVVSLDLRGHGESDKPHADYTIGAFADDVCFAIRELRLSKPVLVGHSMGGTIALETAVRCPDLVSGVVILEALVVAPTALVDQFRQVLDGIKGPAYEAVMRQFNEQLLGPTFDASEKAMFLDRMVKTPQHAAASALEDLLRYDSASAAAKCKAPIIYVSSGPWYTDVQRFRELCPQLVTAQTVGSGHHLQWQAADQVNAIIDGFISAYVKHPVAVA